MRKWSPQLQRRVRPAEYEALMGALVIQQDSGLRMALDEYLPQDEAFLRVEFVDRIARIAAIYRNTVVLEAACRAGADPTRSGESAEQRTSALESVSAGHHIDCLRICLEYCNDSEARQNALYLAAETALHDDDLDAFRFCLDEDVDVNREEHYKPSLTSIAAASGKQAFLELCLEHGGKL